MQLYMADIIETVLGVTLCETILIIEARLFFLLPPRKEVKQNSPHAPCKNVETFPYVMQTFKAIDKNRALVKTI